MSLKEVKKKKNTFFSKQLTESQSNLAEKIQTILKTHQSFQYRCQRGLVL